MAKDLILANKPSMGPLRRINPTAPPTPIACKHCGSTWVYIDNYTTMYDLFNNRRTNVPINICGQCSREVS